MAIYGVNGILTPKSKNKTTDVLLQTIKDEYGTDVVDINYNTVGVLMSYSGRLERKHAKILMHASNGDDNACVVAHSRGALVVKRACEMGATFKTIIIFNGAMDRNSRFRKGSCETLINVYHPDDKALLVARYLPFSRMGSFGKSPQCVASYFVDKYSGINQKMVNTSKPTFKSHSDCFLPENVGTWAWVVYNNYMEGQV